jgi:hypothetical protein
LNLAGATRCFSPYGLSLRSRDAAFIPDQPRGWGSLPSPARTNWYAFENGSNPSPLSSLPRTSGDALPTLSPVGANESRRPCAAFSPLDARQAVLAWPGCPSQLSRWACRPSPRCGLRVAPDLWVFIRLFAREAPTPEGRTAHRSSQVSDGDHPNGHVDRAAVTPRADTVRPGCARRSFHQDLHPA